MMSLYHGNPCTMWILTINNIKHTLLALHQTQKGASIFQGDIRKSRQLSNHMSASLPFIHLGEFIHPDYHQSMNVILQGLWSCDVDVWRPLIAGMAWAMTSANSFIAGPTRRDRIPLQRFLWAQQWPTINKLTGFSTLDATPTHIIAELQHTRVSVYKRMCLGGLREVWPWKVCEQDSCALLYKSGALNVYFHGDKIKSDVPVTD